MRIAHLSDLHVFAFAGVRARDFWNKRLTGAATLLFGRRRAHRVEVVEAAIADILALERAVDHVVVTGDLTNLSLASEFRAAADLLRRLGGRDRVSVVPGNHDVYTSESLGRFEALCAEWLPPGVEGRDGYPWLKLLGDPGPAGVALVGLSTAIPTAWFVAHGLAGAPQLARLRALLARPEVADRFKLVLIHHPLQNEPRRPLYRFRCLRDADDLRAVLAQAPADLVLHGHNHVRWRGDLDGVAVRTAASTSNVGSRRGPASTAWASYVIYDLPSGATERRVYEPATACFVEANGAA